MWPQSQQVLLAFLIRTGSDRLGALTAFEWLLCIGVVSALARTVSLQDQVTPALVVALGAPVVAFQIASAKEDLLLVAAVAATGLCLTTAVTLDEFAITGLFAGIAAGAKYPGLGIAAAAIVWPAIRGGNRSFAKAAVVAAGVAATGGIWYALNLVRYGNPVAPFVWGAHGTPIDAATIREFVNGYGINKTAVGFVLAPFRIFLEPELFCGRANLFNPLAYVGIAALWDRESRQRYAPLLFISGVIYVGWFSTLQNARFLLPAAVLMAPAAADWLVPLIRRMPLLRGLAWGVALMSFGIVVAVGTIRGLRYLKGPDQFLELETQNYADVSWMNGHLDGRRDRVASDHKALAHLTVPWIFLDPTYQLEISRTEMANGELFLEACRREHITHLFGGRDSFPNVRRYLKPVYENPNSRLGGVRFFRTPPTEMTAVFEITYPR